MMRFEVRGSGSGWNRGVMSGTRLSHVSRLDFEVTLVPSWTIAFVEARDFLLALFVAIVGAVITLAIFTL
jgi:hypothetical protein